MGIKYKKHEENGDKREKELGHYLFFIITWHVFSVFKTHMDDNLETKKYFRYKKSSIKIKTKL
jgi:hypothetical protein